MVRMRKEPHAFTPETSGKCSACGMQERTTAHATYARFTDQPCMEVVKAADEKAGESSIRRPAERAM